MNTQNSELAAAKAKQKDEARSESGSGKGKETKVCLPFGYGEGSVPYMASDFDAPLQDFSGYSYSNCPEMRTSAQTSI
jgi:hypothetical protein